MKFAFQFVSATGSVDSHGTVSKTLLVYSSQILSEFSNVNPSACAHGGSREGAGGGGQRPKGGAANKPHQLNSARASMH